MRFRATGVLFLAASLSLSSCGGDAPPEEEKSSEQKKGEKKKEAPAAAKGKKGAANEKVAKGPPLPPRTFRDTDFVESEQNRDPFRNYLDEFRGNKSAVTDQRKVLMPNTPIDSMRLIAIVTGIAQPKAMIVDEKGVGYVTTRGDFVGQAEVVQSGGENLPVTLNWRVDRIRENEVILAREDPTGPNRPPLTRVIALHTEEEGEEGVIGEAKVGDQG